MMEISVPASSANIGPGFDSAGIAVQRYLTLHIEKCENWEIEHLSLILPVVKNVQDHYIYRVAQKIAEKYHAELPACKIKIKTEIPLARGLGSSASAILAGIELANQVAGLSLSDKEKLHLGTEIEGHPDNIAAALFGGLVIAVQSPDNRIEYCKLPNLELDTVTYIPDYELKTEDARNVLPEQVAMTNAAYASGIGNLMFASLLAGNYELAGKMMEQDQFHEPYRKALIPHYEELKQEAKKAGAYGTVISGAGPTLISFVPKGEGMKIASKMGKLFPDCQVSEVGIDFKGLQVKQTIDL